jgi:5-(aminomethyl)-3-furanmethanol phosphate kinase
VLTVVKIGGGIGDDALPGVCAALGGRPSLLVVPGGGRFADAVREADRRFGLNDETAHRMAILGMEQFGHLLGDLIPGAELCSKLDSITGRPSVLLPARLPLDLPASWDVTSDSIAAWVARKVGAGRLVLVKAVAVVDDSFETVIQGARFETAFMTPEEVPDSPLLPSPHG